VKDLLSRLPLIMFLFLFLILNLILISTIWSAEDEILKSTTADEADDTPSL